MRELREKWINDFTALGNEVDFEGKKVRPETKTSIAIGKIFAVEEKGRNNLKVTLKVPGAKYDFSGFMNDNNPVAQLIAQAKEKNAPVAVRFEKKRKKGISPASPIADLIVNSSVARDNIVNIVAGIYNFNDGTWILTDDAVSNPADDPANVEQELKSAAYSTENFFESKNAKKISTSDKDWKVNHLISMYTYASEHNLENKIGLEDKTLKLLASFMLKAVDQLQMRMLNLEEPNYNDYSHTKVRGMLFSWMRINPLSSKIMETKGGFSAWINRFIEENYNLHQWAQAEVDKEETDNN